MHGYYGTATEKYEDILMYWLWWFNVNLQTNSHCCIVICNKTNLHNIYWIHCMCSSFKQCQCWCYGDTCFIAAGHLYILMMIILFTIILFISSILMITIAHNVTLFTLMLHIFCLIHFTYSLSKDLPAVSNNLGTWGWWYSNVAKGSQKGRGGHHPLTSMLIEVKSGIHHH